MGGSILRKSVKNKSLGQTGRMYVCGTFSGILIHEHGDAVRSPKGYRAEFPAESHRNSGNVSGFVYEKVRRHYSFDCSEHWLLVARQSSFDGSNKMRPSVERKAGSGDPRPTAHQMKVDAPLGRLPEEIRNGKVACR